VEHKAEASFFLQQFYFSPAILGVDPLADPLGRVSQRRASILLMTESATFTKAPPSEFRNILQLCAHQIFSRHLLFVKGQFLLKVCPAKWRRHERFLGFVTNARTCSRRGTDHVSSAPFFHT
jgi:hypothetical protein